jgi:uncharacterized membrane protein
MRARANDILVVALAAVVAAAGAMMLPGTALRAIVALPLIFYLPGHAILRAAFRERRSDLATAVFAAGLSIAVTVFCGLALNLIGPLTPARWTIALSTVTLAACCVALARGGSRPIAAGAPRIPALRAGQAVMLACAGALVVAAAIWARHDALAHPEFSYTELWMTPGAGDGAATIGVRNAERAPSSYDLEVTLDGRIVTVRRSIALRVGESWLLDIALPMRDGAMHTVEARLFKNDNDRLVYRRAWLTTGSGERRP